MSDASGAPTGSAAPASIIPYISSLTEEVQPILDDAVLWGDDEPLDTSRVVLVNNSGFLQSTEVNEQQLSYLIGLENVPAARVLAMDGSATTIVGTTVTSTELGYLSGVTSNVQTQFNALPEFGAGRTAEFNSITSGTNQGDIVMGAATPDITVYHAIHTFAFDKTFSGVPRLSLTLSVDSIPNSVLSYSIISVTTTDFTVRMFDLRDTGTFFTAIEWIAIYIPP